MTVSKRGRQIVVAILVLFVVASFGMQVVDQWSALVAIGTSAHPQWATLALAAAVVFASYAVLIETWRQTVIAWGDRISWADARRIWFVSNLAKYVPGGIWQIASMGIMAQQKGVSPAAAIGSSLVVNLVNLVAACIVTMVAGGKALGGNYFVPLSVVAAIAAVATPWLLPLGARAVRRLTGRDVPEPRVPIGAIFFALIGCSVAWVLYGIAFRLLAIALFGAASGNSAAYIAVFTLSYAIGYIWFVAPAGIGAREDAMGSFLTLSHLEHGATGTFLVIASRLFLTVLEAAPGLLYLAAGRIARSTTSPKITDPTNGS